jgi:dienelactone hydrolase
VTLTTSDGVTLEADLHATGQPGGPGVVLLHMVPPHNDRSNYPESFIDRLVKKGITVLNVDRRGAGASGGVAKEAYEGPKGKLDAQAAVGFLTDGPCRVDPSRIALVGASNGTTTAVDYAVEAHADATFPVPKALVFLTGGKYTENQHSLQGHRRALWMPVLFVYSVEEREWSEAQKEQASPFWSFAIFKDGAHGTKMFDAVPLSVERVVEFLTRELTAG